MYVLNLKRLRLPLLISVVLLLAWAVSAWPLGLRLVSSYHTTALVSCPWGAGAGAVGAGPDRLGRLQGPRSFAVDVRGGLLLADTHNHRVLRYAPSGEPLPDGTLEMVAGDYPVHVAADGRGNIYVAPGATTRVLCFDRDGIAAGQVDLASVLSAGTGDPWSSIGDADAGPNDPGPNGPKPDDPGESAPSQGDPGHAGCGDAGCGDPGCGAAPADGDWLLLGIWGANRSGFLGRPTGDGVYAHLVRYGGLGGESRLVYLDRPGGSSREVLRFATAPAEGPGPLPESFCTGARGQLALSFRNGPFGINIRVYDDRGAELWDADLTRDSVITGSQLIGGDRKGHFFLAIEYGASAEVVRFGQRAEPVVVAALEPFRPRPDVGPTDVPYLTTPARVDRDGRAYVAMTDAANFTIARLVPHGELQVRR